MDKKNATGIDKIAKQQQLKKENGTQQQGCQASRSRLIRNDMALIA